MEGRNVVIVTGAANGIGRAFVAHYSGTGDCVVAVDVDASSLSALHTTHGCVVHNVDVSNEAAIRSLVAETIAAYGRIDVFVSNAGILRGVGMAPLEEGPFTPDADWQQSWDVHDGPRMGGAPCVATHDGTGRWGHIHQYCLCSWIAHRNEFASESDNEARRSWFL